MSAQREIGAAWRRIYDLDRVPVAEVNPRDIPRLPGVYAWFSGDAPVYAGKASGKGGLRGRLSKHLATDLDLSRSSLRRNVAEHLLGIPTTVTRQRPTQMTKEDIAVVNAWIHRLALCWLVMPSSETAVTFERQLLGEWMPPLSYR